MKSHTITIALAIVLVAWPAVSQDQKPDDGDPAERQWRLLQKAQEKESPTIMDTLVPPPGLVTIELLDVPIRKAVAGLAGLVREKIEVQPGVKGNITLSLKGIPWRDALARMAKAVGAKVAIREDGSCLVARALPDIKLDMWQDQVKRLKEYRFVDHNVKISPRPAHKLVSHGKLVTHGKLELATVVSPGADTRLLADLEKAVKALRAAGLEEQAKAVEKEISRRKAVKHRWVVIGDTHLLATIRSLRTDVAALRKEVRELTALVKALAEKK